MGDAGEALTTRVPGRPGARGPTATKEERQCMSNDELTPQELADRHTKEQANKALVARFFAEVPLGGNLDAIDELVSETYVQHNPRRPGT